MKKDKQRKYTFRRQAALLLTGVLLAGLLPGGTGAESRAAEQTTLRNPRILKTTQEAAPGTSGKKELKNPTIENGITTWDCIWFGNYWQEDTNGDGKADKNDEKTPIKWRVLSVDGDDVFLLADKNLDVQRYNYTKTDLTWETCTMRSWLNGYGAEMNKEGKDYRDNNFLDNAFSAAEQSAIKTINVVNDDNPKWGTEGGNDTSDQVYLLSIAEVTKREYGFASSDGCTNTRQAVNTAYTAGGEIETKHMGSAGKTDDWWLRSPGISSRHVSIVLSDGSVRTNGYHVIDNGNAARPALHLNLSSTSSWSYAGTVTSDEVAEWDCIWFGNYWQEDTNGDGKADKNDEKTPIKWRVLSVEGDDVFLLADKNLDCQRYNDTNTDVTWETCTMRSWLNGYGAEKNKDGKDYRDNNFLDNAFSADEQSAIKTTSVVNSDNPDHGTEGGNDTSDQVYLLSIDEVKKTEYGFASSGDATSTRQAVNTAYTAGGGEIEIGSEYMGSAGKANNWWLRSPGYLSRNVSYVYDIGDVDTNGGGVYDDSRAARPALHLNLSSASGWSYAGTVTSDNKAEDPGTPTPTATPSPTAPGSTQEPQKTAVPGTTGQPLFSPSPTEPGSTQKPQETVEPGKTHQPGTTGQPSLSPSPTLPGSTQKPQKTAAPGTPSQPGTTGQPFVTPMPTTPGISPDPGKAAVGKVSALKLKQKKGTVTASWKKLSGAKGYQICYSTSKKWKGKKLKLVSKNKAVIKKLKKKKTYYFRVRAYRLEGTRKVYGAWSSVKKMKIKK